MNTARRNIKSRVLLPLAVGLLFILTALSLVSNQAFYSRMQGIASREFDLAQNLFFKEIGHDSVAMNKILTQLTSDDSLRFFARVGDFNSLSERLKKISKQKVVKNNIDRLGLYDPAGNPLFVYSSDTNAPIAETKAKTRMLTGDRRKHSGFHLDYNNKIFLNSVLPWEVDSSLYGYFQASEIAENLIPRLSNLFGTEFIFIASGSDVQIERQADEAVITKPLIAGSSLELETAGRNKLLEYISEAGIAETGRIEMNEHHYLTRWYDLDLDNGENHVQMLMLYDITAKRAGHHAVLTTQLVIGGLISLLLFLAFWRYIHLLDAQLFKLHRDLKSEADEHEKAKQHATEVARRYEMLFESANDGILAMVDGRFVECNSRAAEMYGLSREEVLGRSPLDFSPEFQLDGHTSHELADKYIDNALAGEPQKYDWLHQRADGSMFYTELNLTRAILGGKTHLLAIVRDVNQRKEMEKLYSERMRYEKNMADCSQSLLLSKMDKKTVINSTLHHLLRASQVGRVYIFENIDDPELGLCMKQTYEACSPGVEPQIDNPVLKKLPYSEGFTRWKDVLSKGRAVVGKVSDFPEEEREILKSQGILSILVLPIRVEGNWYGFIGFDDVSKEKEWSEEDVRLLRTVSEMIGAYIERKQSEKTLRRSETRFRELFNNMSSGVVVLQFDKEYDCFYVSDLNKAGEKLDGPDRHDANGKKLEEVFPFVADTDFIEVLRRVYVSGKPENFLLTCMVPKEGQIWRQCYLYKLPTEETVVVYDDITENVQIERALRESEERYRMIADYSTDLISIHDTEGRYTYVSPTIKSLLGYESVEVLGHSAYDFIHEDDIESVRQRHAEIGSSTTPGMTTYRIRCKNGKYLWFETISRGIFDKFSGTIQQLICTSRDVTDRKKTEEELRESRERLRLATEGTGIGIWDFDVVNQHLDWDDRMFEIFDVDRENFGYSFADWEKCVLPEALPTALEDFQRALTGEKEFSIEFPILRRDGQIRHLAGAGIVSRDQAGLPTRVVGVNFDITDRKRFEEELRESESRLRAITDSAQDAIIMLDPQGQVSFWNPAAERIFGYSEKEMIGQDLHQMIAPEYYHAEHKKAFREFKITGRGDAVGKTLELKGLKKDGSEVDVSLSLSAINIKGKWHAVGVMRDITDRIQTEKKLKRLSLAVEQSKDGIAIADLEGNIVYANNSWAEMHGYTIEEMQDCSIEMFHTEAQIQREVMPFHEKVRQNGVHKGEVSHKRKDGSMFPSFMTTSLMKSNEGETIGFIGICRDITEQKESEIKLREYAEDLRIAKEFQEQNAAQLKVVITELEQARKEAESASKAKSQFLANMSHEIRTPMNGIIGMTDLTLDTDLTTEQEDYLSMVKSSAEQLLHLINDILDFSKIEAGQLLLEDIEFDLHKTIETAIEPLIYQAREKKLELVLFVHPLVPERVIGDQARLRQVIVNLVGNAIKFTEKGEVVLKVEMEAGSYQPRFHFSISDTGIGIPEDRLEKIFDSFTQADGSTTRKYGGTGLGTTISMQLVELMGGSIWAESPTNKQDIGGPGSTFHFTLELPTKTDPERSAPLAADLAGKRVLVVDDNLTNRRLICALLENWEMRADCAESGARALKIVHEAKCEGWQYDLFLVDVAMPEMDGVELIRRLSGSNKDIARSCVIISSTHQFSEKGELEKIGCRAYLQKPIRNSRLFDLISKILGSSRQDEDYSSGLTDSESQSGSETGLERKSYKYVRVLLAEDNKINQHLARRLLEKREFKVDTVEDGRQAVEAVLENEYDLVLMDVQMPVMKGSEATRLIRENEREKGGHLPIIALTANAMKGDREHCLEAGMDDHLTKPINPVELYKCIEKYIKIETKGKKQSIT